MKSLTKHSNNSSLKTFTPLKPLKTLKNIQEKNNPRETPEVRRRIFSVNRIKTKKSRESSEISSYNKISTLTLSKELEKTQGDMKKYLPEWLITREDFSKLYLKMICKHELDIGDICLQLTINRSEDEREAVFLWVYNKAFFNKMPRMLVRETCDKLITVRYFKGEIIMKKGDEGDCMYIIYKGLVGIYVNGHRVGSRTIGEVLGETALDTDKPRTADAIAEENLVMLKLKKIDYTNILLNLKKFEKYESSKFLISIDLFSKWSLPRIQIFSEHLIPSHYKDGEIIYEHQSESNAIYIITSGTVIFQKFVHVTKHNKWPIGIKKWEIQKVTNKFLVTIGKLSKKGIFGLETINDLYRESRATAEGDISCLILNKNECFEQLTHNDIQQLNSYSLIIPKDEEMQNIIKKKSFNRIERVIYNKENILLDALQVNYTNWGGRETEKEKKNKKINRCVSSLRLHLRKHHALIPVEQKTYRENIN